MLDRYVGLPWVDKGRDFAGVDCWGLVWLIFKTERGIELPCYVDHYRTAADEDDIRRLIAGEIAAWDEIAAGAERCWDCLLMRGQHIGLVIEPGLVLQVREGHHSCVERYRSGAVRSRVLGFYRYRG